MQVFFFKLSFQVDKFVSSTVYERVDRIDGIDGGS
jgi:hypothetical protein